MEFCHCPSFLQIWASNWGELYAKDEPQLYGGKIDQLEKKMTQIPAERIITNSQMSYKFVQPYKEFGPNFKRRTFDKFDTLVGMEDEEENIEYKEEKKSGKRRRRGCL